MEVTVNNLPLSGEVSAISSKSFAHRIIIASSLARYMTGRDTEIILNGGSEDISATQRVTAGLFDGSGVLNCGESGTTLRLTVPVCCALGIREETIFTGQGRLMQRPMEPLAEAMRSGGGVIISEADRIICRGRLKAGDYTIAANVSSQYISGLLFALPIIDGTSTLTLTGRVESRPYIDITLEVLKKFGITVEEGRDAEGRTQFKVEGGQTYRSPGTVYVEGDWSNAAFWLAAGALGGGSVTVKGLNPASTQGDRKICDMLGRFGAYVAGAETGDGQWAVTCSGGAGLFGTDIDAKDIPDMVPVLSAVAAAAQGKTEIYNAGRLRIKESDRLKTVTAMLRSLGAGVEEGKDYLIIEGRAGCTDGENGLLPGGCVVDGCGDHRIVMSAAVAAAACRRPVTIAGAEAVNKSYPGFFEEREKLCPVHGEETSD